jgi:ribosomal protein S2
MNNECKKMMCNSVSNCEPSKDTKKLVDYSLFDELLQNQVLFGLKSNNKHLNKYFWESRERYNFLSAEVYVRQMESLAVYLGKYYDKDELYKNLYIMDTQNRFPVLFSTFAKFTGFVLFSKKMNAGLLTNSQTTGFLKPSGIFIIHDKKEKQPFLESVKTKTPILGFNNLVTNNVLYTRVVIMNNFNIQSLIYSVWYLLTLLNKKGYIKFELVYSQFKELVTIE